MFFDLIYGLIWWLLGIWTVAAIGYAIYMRKRRPKVEEDAAVRAEKGELNIIPRKRITIASFIVGCFGGVIAGLWVYFWISQAIGFRSYLYSVGIVSGFLSCFFISEWYLKYMEYKRWQWGFLFGPLFAALAGTISGIVTIFGSMLEDIGRSGFEPRSLLLVVNFSLLFGGGSGLVLGLISSLTFGAIRALSPKKRI
jgi:hypothetical protein